MDYEPFVVKAYLTEKQADWLRTQSFERRVPQTEIIRELIDAAREKVEP